MVDRHEFVIILAGGFWEQSSVSLNFIGTQQSEPFNYSVTTEILSLLQYGNISSRQIRKTCEDFG